MKVSHPQFFTIGSHEVLKIEFPGCLEKRENAIPGYLPSKTNKASDNVFLFPEVSIGHQVSLPINL